MMWQGRSCLRQLSRVERRDKLHDFHLFYLVPLKITLWIRVYRFSGVFSRGGYCFSPGLHFASTIIEASFRRIWKFQRLDWLANYLGPKLLAEIRELHFVSWSYILLHLYIRRIGLSLDGLFSPKRPLYVRDYLLPAPANSFRGFKRKELTYHTAFAVQSQIVSLAACRGLRIFRTPTSHYYTPHSGRNFMPTSTAVLGFSKSDRDMLGGWAAEGSERYSRAAKFKIGMMQKAVSSTFGSADHDPLAETDDLDAMGVFSSHRAFPRMISFAEKRSWSPGHLPMSFEMLLRMFLSTQSCKSQLVELFQDESLDESLAMKKKTAKEKQQVSNRSRSELLGSDHKTTRASLRDQLDPGYYISYSGQKAIKVLHCLGHCFMLPGVLRGHCHSGFLFLRYGLQVVREESKHLGRHGFIGFKHFLFD